MMSVRDYLSAAPMSEAMHHVDLPTLVARILVQIWVNLNKHCVNWKKTSTEISFRRIVLPLLYMLQAPLTFKSQNLDGMDGPDRLPQFVIIPRIEFTDLLPVESNVSKFHIETFCTPCSKTITSIQTHIQKFFWDAVQRGKINDVRIKLSDFY